MKNFKLSRLLAAAALVACLSFTGCKPAEDTTAQQLVIISAYNTMTKAQKIQLKGTWVESGSWGNSYYKFTDDGLENYGDNYQSYAGNEIVFAPTSVDSGTAFIKYTRAADANGKYTTDPALASDIGKWYAISYKDLTATSVKISGAYKVSGKTSCATLEEAMLEFTVANGYFSIYSSCKRHSY